MIRIKGDHGLPTSWECSKKELAGVPYLGGRINRIRVDVGGEIEKEVGGACRLLFCTTRDKNVLHLGNRGGSHSWMRLISSYLDIPHMGFYGTPKGDNHEAAR